jgi:eukaryotic-like serine/threonine-protein kinase
MPPPVNAADFLAIVEKSGLLQEKDLDTYRFRSTADPSPPDRVANWLVMDGRLTPFQVGLLLAGKSRPFFVGPYKVLSRIGNGSMGVVYLCEHRDMRRRVAVKILQSRRASDEVALERFLREARAAAALNHPNVVHALDVGCADGLHYLVMEYIDGQSLKELILTEGPLPPLKAADFLRQAAMGVQHAHEAGFIHRDIKPSNLMIDRSGVVKLLDLGLARFDDGDIDLTRGATIGNLAYVAPEQALDSHAVDARADVYSLGATFYLALAGRPPVPCIGIVDQSQLSDPTDYSRLMAVLRRMTAQDPANRYQTAAEVAVELAGWAIPDPPMAIALPPTEPDTSEPPVQDISEGDIVSASPVQDTGEGDIVSEPPPPPLAFDTSPPRKPLKVVAKTANAAIPWWRVRRWQLLILGLAVVVGLLAALIVSARATPAKDTTTELAPNQ